MKKARLLTGIAVAATAAMAMTTMASAYTIDKSLGKNWSLNATIPASEFAELSEKPYVTITFTVEADDLSNEAENYWSIKPMDSSWTFIDPNGVGGPELAEAKDAYPVEQDATSITFKVPDDYIDVIKEGGMIIIGHRLHLNEMTLSAEAPAAPAPDDGGDETQAPDNGNTDAPTPDKNTPDTGVEGVAIVAALAIVATGAVVVARKRK